MDTNNWWSIQAPSYLSNLLVFCTNYLKRYWVLLGILFSVFLIIKRNGFYVIYFFFFLLFHLQKQWVLLRVAEKIFKWVTWESTKSSLPTMPCHSAFCGEKPLFAKHWEGRFPFIFFSLWVIGLFYQLFVLSCSFQNADRVLLILL